MRRKYSEIEQNLMEVMARNLKAVLSRTNTSQKDLAAKTGYSESAISDYATAKTLMSPGVLQHVADALGVAKSEIDPTFRSTVVMESTATYEVNALVQLPIVGRISCGNGNIAYEDIEGYEPTPREWLNGGEYFYLRAKGDSMKGARINHGDLLLIRKQPEVENGEIAAVLIGEDAMLKKVFRNGDQLVLQSENPDYPPIFAPPAEAQIIGKLKMNVITY